jgi:hypothetical protein
MRPADLPDTQRKNFARLLEEEMRNEQEEDGVSHDKAFLRVALNTLGFDPDGGYHTDGPFDYGLDFVHVSEEEASIFQAKSLAIHEGIPLEAMFDASYLADLRRIVEVLQHLDKLPKDANKQATEALTNLRNSVNRRALLPVANALNGETTSASEPGYKIAIYFLGLARGFTAQAETELQRIEALSQIQFGRVRIEISVMPVFIDDLLSEKWQQRNVEWRNKQGNKRDEVSLSVAGQVIVDAKSAVFFTHAYGLVQAYEDYGYQIFEPNVRCERKESKVNKAIKGTVTTREGRREFRHLNNGITVVCTGYTRRKQDKNVVAFVARKPGVVNGLQTVKSLHDAFRRLPQDDQIDFKDNCLVLCRLHQEGAVSRLEELVKATNNQNPMKPRNLRSNDPEQTAYETLFANFCWFYERKQGAWDAFKADPKGWRGLDGKRRDAFQIQGGNRYRVVDNDEMAQNWLAFIGFSTEAINEKRTIFESDPLYTMIFLRRTLKHGYDYDFNLTQDSAVHRETTEGSPAPQLLLAAWLCRQAADKLAVGRRDNRDTSTERLGLVGKSRDEQDRALEMDTTYQINKIIRGTLTLFVEFVGFVMFRALGDRLHTDGVRIIENGAFRELATRLDSSEMVAQYRQQQFQKNDLLPILFAAFEHCVKQLYESNWLRGYNDAAVKNKFIYSSRTRKELLDELLELDRRFARGEWVRSWADGFNEAGGVFAHVHRILQRTYIRWPLGNTSG